MDLSTSEACFHRSAETCISFYSTELVLFQTISLVPLYTFESYSWLQHIHEPSKNHVIYKCSKPVLSSTDHIYNSTEQNLVRSQSVQLLFIHSFYGRVKNSKFLNHLLSWLWLFQLSCLNIYSRISGIYITHLWMEIRLFMGSQNGLDLKRPLKIISSIPMSLARKYFLKSGCPKALNASRSLELFQPWSIHKFFGPPVPESYRPNSGSAPHERSRIVA